MQLTDTKNITRAFLTKNAKLEYDKIIGETRSIAVDYSLYRLTAITGVPKGTVCIQLTSNQGFIPDLNYVDGKLCMVFQAGLSIPQDLQEQFLSDFKTAVKFVTEMQPEIKKLETQLLNDEEIEYAKK